MKLQIVASPVRRDVQRCCCAFALLLLPLALSAQTITYSTANVSQDLSAVAWRVTACTTGPQWFLAQGVAFQQLVEHGAKPMFNVEAQAVFSEAPSRSVAGRLVEWSGYAVAGAGLLMTTDTIKVSQQTKIAVNFGSAFLNVAIPFARQKVPQVSPLRDLLIGGGLIVPAGGCASGVMLGTEPRAGDFKVVM